MAFTTNTNLVGDVRFDDGYEEIERCFNELEDLMVQHRSARLMLPGQNFLLANRKATIFL